MARLYRLQDEGLLYQILSIRLLFNEQPLPPIAWNHSSQHIKVGLAKVLASQPNVLILDEPTNHLDVHVREALENALADYSGTIIVASHDRYLIKKLADEILEINGKETKYFPGSYSELKSKVEL